MNLEATVLDTREVARLIHMVKAYDKLLLDYAKLPADPQVRLGSKHFDALTDSRQGALDALRRVASTQDDEAGALATAELL